jgi:hydrogenase maturation protease
VRHSKLAPGTVVELRDEQILRGLPAPRLSPHDPNLRDALLAAEWLGGPPRRITLFGVVPARVELGTGLTPEVSDALPRLGASGGRRAGGPGGASDPARRAGPP